MYRDLFIIINYMHSKMKMRVQCKNAQSSFLVIVTVKCKFLLYLDCVDITNTKNVALL